MNTDSSTHHPNTDWQVLGEIKLPVSVGVENVSDAWLKELLHLFTLQEELLNKIIASAQDAIVRAIQADRMLKPVYIHLAVFVPSAQVAKVQAWGFFRLEKIGDMKDEPAGRKHAVEFYLYGEGD